MKKKIIGVFVLIVVCICAVWALGTRDKVLAEANNCVTYTNFYFFSDAYGMGGIANKTQFDALLTQYYDGAFTSSNSTYDFPNEFETGYDTNSVTRNWLNVNGIDTTGTSISDAWSLNKFWTMYHAAYMQINRNSLNYYEDPSLSTATNKYRYFMHGKWTNIDTGTLHYYDEQLNLTDIDSGLLAKATVFPVTTGSYTVDLQVSTFTLNRSLTAAGISSDWTPVTITDNEGVTSHWALAPALYYIRYNVCEAVTPPPAEEDEYTYEINYFVYNSNTKVYDSETSESWDGVNINIKSPTGTELFAGYRSCTLHNSYDSTVTVSTTPATNRGEYSDDLKTYSYNVYYDCDATAEKYTLTIRYWKDEVTTVGSSNYIDEYVAGENFESGSKYTGTGSKGIIGVSGYTYSEIKKSVSAAGLSVDGDEFTVTMPASNVVIDIIYTPKTGDWPIYIVWGIGAAALGYSIYYFNKYYKKEKAVV